MVVGVVTLPRSETLRQRAPVGWRGKRTFDLGVAGLGILLGWPILLAISLLVKLTSRGPVFYRGERTGVDGKVFCIYKFRTMHKADEDRGPKSTAVNDTRITFLGRFLRQYKLDELPQLFNALAGDMSIVGPRPELPYYTRQYRGLEMVILSVRPGITDYASVTLRHMGDELALADDPDRHFEQVIRPRKNALRVRYALQHSLWEDLRIMALTVRAIFAGR